MVLTESVLKEAGAVTLGFAGAFAWNTLIQVFTKVQSVKRFKAAKSAGSKEKYNRYEDPYMLAADRSVGNFIEWQGAFLSLFWLNAALTGKDISLGWLYVAVRLLYPILAFNGGIKNSGAHPLIFVATVPGYCVLFRYAWNIYCSL